jgi:HSP20 family protein
LQPGNSSSTFSQVTFPIKPNPGLEKGEAKMKGQAAFAPAASPTVITMPEPVSTFDHTLTEIYNAVSSRAYELFAQRGYSHGQHFNDWLRAESEILQPLPVEITDNDDTFTVRAEVPGFAPKDLEVKVESSRLLIRGEAEKTRQRSSGKTIYSECQKNQIFRVVNLPTKINPDTTTASVQDGVLHVTLPKATTVRANRVEVKAA